MEINSYFFWQLFWILAAIITICAFIYNDKKKTLNLLLIGWVFWILQFALLWALSWAFVNIFWFVRTLLAKYNQNDKRLIIFLFLIIVIISYFTYSGPLSLLPLIATLIWTYALFYYQWVTFRVMLVIPTTLWLIYNYHVGSIWGTIREIIILLLHIKVIILSLGFAYRKEIYTLNYDIFVYIYNNSVSWFTLLWKRFLHSFYHVYNIFSRRRKWIISKKLSH